jgi:hypothetical protein
MGICAPMVNQGLLVSWGSAVARLDLPQLTRSRIALSRLQTERTTKLLFVVTSIGSAIPFAFSFSGLI